MEGLKKEKKRVEALLTKMSNGITRGFGAALLLWPPEKPCVKALFAFCGVRISFSLMK